MATEQNLQQTDGGTLEKDFSNHGNGTAKSYLT